ncbi:MAG: DMT family transporter [Clostridia bacterium]|nr:DMT family transporter [Clostridia bacterium]
MAGKIRFSPLFLVVFGVCMVSYSGPMVKGALHAGANPASIAALRMLSAGGILALRAGGLRPAFRRTHPQSAQERNMRPARTDSGAGAMAMVGLAALFLAGHYLAWIFSLTGVSTFASVALVSTQPLFVALFSYLLFRETIPRRAVPGAALALLGALLIALAAAAPGQAELAGGGQGAAGLTNGEGASGLSLSVDAGAASGAALLGAALMAAHWLTARRVRAVLPARIYTPALYLATGSILAVSVPFLGGFHMPGPALPYMAGLVLGSTLLGHALFSSVIETVSPGVISFALLGEPLGAMLFAMLFLGEFPSPWVLAGGAVTLLGLCLYLAVSLHPRAGTL